MLKTGKNHRHSLIQNTKEIMIIVTSHYKFLSGNFLFFLLSSVVTTLLHLRVVILLLETVKRYSEPRVVEKVDQERTYFWMLEAIPIR